MAKMSAADKAKADAKANKAANKGGKTVPPAKKPTARKGK